MTITFGKSNKNSPVNTRCWQCHPPDQQHSLYLHNMFLLTLWSMSHGNVEISWQMWLLTSSRVWGFILHTSSFKASIILRGCSFDNFVALPTDVFKTLIHWGTCFRDFLGEVSCLATVSCNFASISRVCYLPRFLSARDPAVFSLLTKQCTLCLLESDSFGNCHQNFL